jgi:signal-transduction protein with cAMP-binding, CBS, and nucleotidyltransferase domain
VTDRDLVVILAEGLDPDEATVECLAFRPLRTIGPGASLADAARAMREAGVRRLPIVDLEGRLVGLVSLDDVLVALGREVADVQRAISGELGRERGVASVRAWLRQRADREPGRTGPGRPGR